MKTNRSFIVIIFWTIALTGIYLMYNLSRDKSVSGKYEEVLPETKEEESSVQEEESPLQEEESSVQEEESPLQEEESPLQEEESPLQEEELPVKAEVITDPMQYVDHYDDDNFFHNWFKTRTTGPLADKWVPYFRTYERHFGRYRNKNLVFVEVGVQSGGSTFLWPDYFGPGLRYYGLDINKNCEQFERKDPQKGIFVQIDFVNQESIQSLENATKIFEAPDIILDDGGHTMVQQINTFKVFWPYLKNGGVYCCEDTHTSYMGGHYRGGYKGQGTFIEYVKDFIDILHLVHMERPPGLEKEEYYHSTIRTITFADSIVCFEKGNVEPFDRLKSGTYTIPY